MAKYRKKPLIVEAVQWFEHGDHPEVSQFPFRADNGWLATLEGTMIVRKGDWVVGPGVQGEFWPVKPDIFEKTYEKVGPSKNYMVQAEQVAPFHTIVMESVDSPQEEFKEAGYLPVERVDPKDSESHFVIEEGKVVGITARTEQRFGQEPVWTRNQLIEAAEKLEASLREEAEPERAQGVVDFLRFLDINI